MNIATLISSIGAGAVGQALPSLSLSAASVPENSPTGTAIGTVTPTNARNPGAVSIASQTPANSLQMNVDGVTVEVGAAGLDYETAPTISVTFEYTDDDGTYQFARTIYVTDVAEGGDAVLIEDGTSRILLEDGTSKLLLEA